MRAEELQRYLGNHRRIVHAKLVSASADKDADVVEMDVDVDLPQRPLHRISQTERIRVRFPSNDEMPQVFALRKSFPSLPHLVLREEEYPRQLCLYQRPWSDESENWAPRAFVERIRRWLAGTADGTLHRTDQPLEPIILNSPFRIALPEVPYVAGKLCRIERFFVTRASKSFWVGQRKKPTEASGAFALPVIFVQGPAATHGIIHQLPLNLGDLEKVLVKLGGSLIEAISMEMAVIRAELAGVAKESLMIVVELPKIRVAGGPVESVEHQAFIVGAEIGDLLKVEEVQVRKGRLWIPEKRELFRDPKRLQSTKLMPLSVRWHLSPKNAAEMNGYAPNPVKVVAIGAGSLGSQTINNLWRGGFGEWTLVDDDIVEPHNPARHLVNSHAVGFKKAHAMSAEMDSVYPGREPPAWIDCNYLSPGAQEAKLELALKNAELIVDLSASVAVERRLAKDRRSSARRISAFLNQRGDESVLLVEDSGRKVELAWLEAEYMRALAFDARMIGHFDNVEIVAHRYGNGCRDVSSTVAQDGVAIHAGLLSHGIRRAADKKEAAVRINRWSRETGAVSVVDVAVSAPLAVEMAGWEVMVHPDVVQQLDELRTKNLPNETGGVLLGIVDRTQRFVSVVGMLPAPPDSEVWPTSFIRGSNGLARAVDKITKRTLGNVIYVGEWHSHPAGYDATPSVPDLAAIAICSPNTRADGLPTLMLIVAERELCLVLQPTDRDEIHVMKIAA
jgi:Prokaryotic E2 family A/ThiF family/Prokaryotic homologs of the JAB domain